jgi:hypothetical protein
MAGTWGFRWDAGWRVLCGIALGSKRLIRSGSDCSITAAAGVSAASEDKWFGEVGAA